MQQRTTPVIGFVLSHEQFPAPELVQLGIAAEQAGFDLISTSDHFQPWQDNEGHSGLAWETLAALGQRTQRILMGTMVTCPTYRYRPAIVAEAFATLSLLNPGRIFLGVGTGEALNEIPSGGGWGPYAERAERLKEAVMILRGLWSGQPFSYAGDHYQIKQARLYDAPPHPVPIYIAGYGPKSMQLAGEYGDGLITQAKLATKPDGLAPYHEAARQVKKDPRTMPVFVEQMVVVGNRQEAQRWAELWRFMPKSFNTYVTDPDPRSIRQRAEREVPIEQVYEKWPISENPDDHIQGIRKLVESGVTHVMIHSPQGDQARVIDFYGKQVLPRLRPAVASR
jgi:F420-dependent hydroxymycolic acid dehydrogenase